MSSLHITFRLQDSIRLWKKMVFSTPNVDSPMKKSLAQTAPSEWETNLLPKDAHNE